MSLKNERPSMLHSMILNFGLNYSKTHNDFKFYSFFLLWNPENLRYEDLQDGTSKSGDKIPSLISRICRELVNTNIEISIEEFVSKIKLTKETILDFFREAIFWNIFNSHKENKFSELWNLFEQYNNKYSQQEQSKWHSEILNLAERFMKEHDEWRFLNFFKNWNPENLRNEDWKETKKDEQTYKPLATKAIKKAFEIIKVQPSNQNLSWLTRVYEKAIKFFPNDEWLLREKALLHFKNNELELSATIYKKLVLDLHEKYYVWQEYANCIVSDNILKIGMLSKALTLEKNEDFLGDIHLELARVLINENLIENAFIELNVYKKHREMKGKKLSAYFEELYQKVNGIELSLEENHELYKKYIPFAENFAYSDLDWTEVVLVDKWKDNKGKERLIFTNGKMVEFVTDKNRFEILKHYELGKVYKFKIYDKNITEEDFSLSYFTNESLTIDVHEKYIPLTADNTEKENWGILDETFAVVDYINKEKNVIHAITKDNIEVFFPGMKDTLNVGDFIAAKSFLKKIKLNKHNSLSKVGEKIDISQFKIKSKFSNEKLETKKDGQRLEIRDVKKVKKEEVITHFHSNIAIVDGINETKQLFHFVINASLQGIVRFSETALKPYEGDFIKITFVKKLDKEKKIRLKVLDITTTAEKNKNLRRNIIGELCVTFKSNIIKGSGFPDFAFINDDEYRDNFYVPQYLLVKNNITDDCFVEATAVFNGEKWKVINLKK